MSVDTNVEAVTALFAPGATIRQTRASVVVAIGAAIVAARSLGTFAVLFLFVLGNVVYSMNFNDGEYLETDLILFSAGIRPQDALGRSAGLEIAARGGVAIDNACRTSASKPPLTTPEPSGCVPK